MKRFMLVFALLLLCLVAVLPALAQDAPPSPSPVQPELEAALTAILELVNNLTFSPLTAAFVVAVVALLKKVIPESLSVGTLALIVQVLVWVALVAAKHFGVEDQFNTWLGTITTILGAVTGLVASSYLSTRFYNAARDKDVPLLGDTR